MKTFWGVAKVKPDFNISPLSVLTSIDETWKRKFKRLHNEYPLRYGHCSIWKQAKEIDPEDYERRSTISILCTETQEWSDFLNELNADSTDKAVWSFLILLLTYRSPSGYDISFDALIESYAILSNELKSINKERIPEFVLARLVSCDDQGDPNDPLSVFFEPSSDIVVSYIEATVVRGLQTLASWGMAPCEVLEHQFDENDFRDFSIESRYETYGYYEALPRVCYDALVMDELSHWDKGCSFWNFLEQKIQGKCREINERKPKGNFPEIGSLNSECFNSGSFRWEESRRQGMRLCEKITRRLEEKGGLKFRPNLNRLYFDETFSFEALKRNVRENTDKLDVWIRISPRNVDITDDATATGLLDATATFEIGDQSRELKLDFSGECVLEGLESGVICRFVRLNAASFETQSPESAQNKEIETLQKTPDVAIEASKTPNEVKKISPCIHVVKLKIFRFFVNWSTRRSVASAMLLICGLGVGVILFGLNDGRHDVAPVDRYRYVAERGDVLMQFNLGVCYEKGDGVEQNYKIAVDWYRKAAEFGLAEAQLALGSCYVDGKGVERDCEEAFRWYRKAAEQGNEQAKLFLDVFFHNDEGVERGDGTEVERYRKAAEKGDADAQNSLGNCYCFGNGVKKDYKIAVEWYRKAAEKGNADAQNNLGSCYHLGNGVKKDYKIAVEWYRKAAEKGNADAQNSLGYCYYFGDGVKKDYKIAVEWCRKAAEQGLAEAQRNLGFCYAEGLGVEQDYKVAVEWYRKATEQGNADAQNSLGFCYYYGFGVERDYKLAFDWYYKAAVQGNANAQCNLGVCYVTGNGVGQNYETAVEWFRNAAEQGNTKAQNSLGDCYYFGNGVKKDYKVAVEWFRNAAEQGYTKAQCNLALCYYNGRGVKRDYKAAFEWYSKAAEQGDSGAQCGLGVCYRNGQGVERDYKAAFEWFSKAAEQGYSEAQRNLGDCYYYGLGVDEDYEVAVDWYYKAFEQRNTNAKYDLLGIYYYYGSGYRPIFWR